MRWLPIVLWVSIILYLSFDPLEYLPEPKLFGLDKLVHIVMYLVLGLLFILPMQVSKMSILFILIPCLFLSAITEVIQHHFIINRYGEWSDFASNVIGLSIGLWILNNKIKT